MIGHSDWGHSVSRGDHMGVSLFFTSSDQYESSEGCKYKCQDTFGMTNQKPNSNSESRPSKKSYSSYYTIIPIHVIVAVIIFTFSGKIPS